MLSISPDDAEARGALREHLSDLRNSARDLGMVHLEGAVAEALSRLERESFGPGALVVVRVLAWRYETLAAMRSQSGTHRVIEENDDAPPSQVSLRGRRVLVAHAQSEVRWSYVGVLREAGARVIEARDGVHAVDLARGDIPDLVLSAMEMPRLDGLGLCAALRREPALDGIPVVLLSGDPSGQEILERVARGLVPIVRLEEWLKSDLEATGDLEELGVSVLLRAVRRLRPNATMVLQDPWSLFDLEFCEGRIVAATRTAIDGSVTSGAAAFPPLVGMSSGRFVVAQNASTGRRDERPSLDAAFADATQRLGVLLARIATHSECRVRLDDEALATYLRHSPVAVQRLIGRLVAGEPPNALWESGAGSRGLVDAILVTLARQGAIQDIEVPEGASPEGHVEVSMGPDRELIVAAIEQDSSPMAEPVERENVRANLGVAMHREPTNRGPSWAHPIWRLNVTAGTSDGESRSGFGAEIQRTSRLLGLAFVTLLGATVGFLLWGQVDPASPPPESPVAKEAPAPQQEPELSEVEAQAVTPQDPANRPRLSALSGSLRDAVDPSLSVSPDEGVLELTGPGEVRVVVDGVDRGALPTTLVLEEGIHAVRYREETKSADRFYYVKSGTTRAVDHIAQGGAFVDAL